MINIFKPAPHIERVSEEQVDPFISVCVFKFLWVYLQVMQPTILSAKILVWRCLTLLKNMDIQKVSLV